MSCSCAWLLLDSVFPLPILSGHPFLGPISKPGAEPDSVTQINKGLVTSGIPEASAAELLGAERGEVVVGWWHGRTADGGRSRTRRDACRATRATKALSQATRGSAGWTP